MYIGPATRDKLLPNVSQGLADVAIGNLTVTEERQQRVDFVVGDEGQRTLREIVVTGPRSPAIATIDDLSGKFVHVRKASSYYESLEALNERFKREGRAAMNVVFVPDSLEDEDMMEMLDAGLIEVMVVDDWKAHMWAQVLPNVKVRTDLVLRASPVILLDGRVSQGVAPGPGNARLLSRAPPDLDNHGRRTHNR